jgi:hypothetical protein
MFVNEFLYLLLIKTQPAAKVMPGHRRITVIMELLEPAKHHAAFLVIFI